MEIIQVVPRCDLKVYVYDDLGNIYIYDAAKFAKKYIMLQDKNFFINRCTIINNTLAWDKIENRDNGQCIYVSHASICTSSIVQEKEVFKYVEQHKIDLKERLGL